MPRTDIIINLSDMNFEISTHSSKRFCLSLDLLKLPQILDDQAIYDLSCPSHLNPHFLKWYQYDLI